MPNNPSGAVLTRRELPAIAEVVRAHDLWVISDEIYHRVTYGADPVSIAGLPGMQERTVVINGVSKTYAMTGWRIGFAAGPRDVIQAMVRFQSHATSNPATMSQAAAAAALLGDQDSVASMRQRRDLLVQGLRQIPRLVVPRPAGTFFVFCDAQGLEGRSLDGLTLSDGSQLAMALLRRANVSVAPGDGFGMDHAIRLSFAVSDERIQTGVARRQELLGGSLWPTWP